MSDPLFYFYLVIIIIIIIIIIITNMLLLLLLLFSRIDIWYMTKLWAILCSPTNKHSKIRQRNWKCFPQILEPYPNLYDILVSWYGLCLSLKYKII